MGNFPLLLHCNPKKPQPPWRFILSPERFTGGRRCRDSYHPNLHIISLEKLRWGRAWAVERDRSTVYSPPCSAATSSLCVEWWLRIRVCCIRPLLMIVTPFFTSPLLVARSRLVFSEISPESRISDVFCFADFDLAFGTI